MSLTTYVCICYILLILTIKIIFYITTITIVLTLLKIDKNIEVQNRATRMAPSRQQDPHPQRHTFCLLSLCLVPQQLIVTGRRPKEAILQIISAKLR